jgi:glyoxylase-like metal-dependent hydrolase (beta-lactamase superfamily II)
MTLLYGGDIRMYRTFCGADGNNAYLLGGLCPWLTLESIIIDAPLHPEGVLGDTRDTTVMAVLITHQYEDHWEGLPAIKAHTGAPVGMHERDIAGVPFSPDFTVDDDAVVHADSIKLRIFHTSGHTLGSVCFWFPGIFLPEIPCTREAQEKAGPRRYDGDTREYHPETLHAS